MSALKKNILYLAHRIPYPPNKGDKIRSYHEVKYLSESHNVDLICLADDPKDYEYEFDLEKMCNRVRVFPINGKARLIIGLSRFLTGKSITEGYFYKPGFQQLMDKWIREKYYDAIVCFSSPMAEYVFRCPFILGSTRLIMDFCDVDSDKWKQYSEDSSFLLSIVYSYENRRLLLYEKKVNQHFHHSVFVSQKERELFHTLVPEAQNSGVISNGVDTDFFTPDSSASTPPLLMFAGAMDYHANVQGITWFCDNVFPALLKKHEGLTLNIVGSNPRPEVQVLAKRQSINVTGFVKDIRPYYRDASVCIIPLFIARGVQNKVLEAMAMGKAIVTTPEAIQSIEVIHGKHLMVAQSGTAFGNCISNILNNPVKLEELGRQARILALGKFSWSENMQHLCRLVARQRSQNCHNIGHL